MKQKMEQIKVLIERFNLNELSTWLAHHPEELTASLNTHLNLFRDALSIINALMEQGAYALIPVLEKADKPSLHAFAELTKDNDVHFFAETFLIDNAEEFDQINRTQLIQFLRQPDLESRLNHYIGALHDKTKVVMSLRFLILILELPALEKDMLKHIDYFLNQYPFEIDLKVLCAFVETNKELLNTKEHSPESSKLIQIINEVLHRSASTTRAAAFREMDEQTFQLLIKNCLYGLTQPNRDPCFKLLSTIIHHAQELPESLQLSLTELLSQQDAYLFLNPVLHQRAKEVSYPPDALLWKWIEVLLTSEEVIAQCNSTIIRNLIDRYQLMLLLFNQNHPKRLAHAMDNDSVYQNILDSVTRIESDCKRHPEHLDSLQEKKFQLLEFTIEKAIQLLLIRFTGSCEQKKPMSAITQQALKVLFTEYYFTQPYLRADLFYHALNAIYNINNLNIPGFNIEELPLEEDVGIYNSIGQRIGSLNEKNEVEGLVDDAPMLLINTGALQPNDSLYDKSGIEIGVITQSGHFKSADFFQKNISAYILATLPETVLMEHPAGLRLLIKSLMLHQAHDQLFNHPSPKMTAAKQNWLEAMITHEIAHETQVLAKETFDSIIIHHCEKNVFRLLAQCSNTTNALYLFHSILMAGRTRELLFNQNYEQDFALFLDRHAIKICFAYYLTHFHEMPWFNQGLEIFARHAQKQKKTDLLSSSLSILSEESIDNQRLTEQFDALLLKLITSPECAYDIVRLFFLDTHQIAVQQVINPEIALVAAFFKKNHLINGLKKLNQTINWEEHSLYKLILYVAHHQFTEFFLKTKVHQSKPLWQQDELLVLGDFIKRHLNKKCSFDDKHTLGYLLLGELIFRSAQLGQTSLFYSELFNKVKKVNLNTAGLFLSRKFLEQLVYQFYPNNIPNDWNQLINKIWGAGGKQKIPAICVFIMNYSGGQKPLAHLIYQFIRASKKTEDHIHPIADLLRLFPERDFSSVIFNVLEAVLRKNSSLLDGALFKNMSHFYSMKLLGHDESRPNKELDLLLYFGQNKQYLLVEKGCALLIASSHDEQLLTLLRKVAKEARVEASLSGSMGHFYFSFIKALKRLWHYGFNPSKNSSKMVAFCDEELLIPEKFIQKKVMQPKVEIVKNSTLNFTVKKAQFINLLAAIRKSPSQRSMTKASTSNHSLFSFSISEPTLRNKDSSVSTQVTV